MGQIANRESLALSERSQLSQAIPQFCKEQLLHVPTPIARFESQSSERSVSKDQCLCVWGKIFDRQQLNASDSNCGDNSRLRFCDNYCVIFAHLSYSCVTCTEDLQGTLNFGAIQGNMLRWAKSPIANR